jgi:hypothetical protein
MIILSGIFFAMSLGSVLFQSMGNVNGGGNEWGWALSGIFTLIGLPLLLKGIFSEKRMHEQSHHSLP